MSAISGWYPDPAGSPDLRFWDGERWAAATMPRPVSAPQGPAVALAPPPGVAQPRSPVTPVAPQWAYSRPGIPYAPTPPLPKPRRRTSKWVTALAVIIVVGVVASVISKVNDNANTQSALAHTTIQLPDQIDGLQKITGPLADQLANAASNPDLDIAEHLVGGYSLADGRPRMVVIVGKIGLTSTNIGKGMTAAERGFHSAQASQGGTLTTFHKVAAGPLGGEMECGTAVFASVPGTACLFVDRAVAGMVGMYDIDGTDDQALALQARSAIETRT